MPPRPETSRQRPMQAVLYHWASNAALPQAPSGGLALLAGLVPHTRGSSEAIAGHPEVPQGAPRKIPGLCQEVLPQKQASVRRRPAKEPNGKSKVARGKGGRPTKEVISCPKRVMKAAFIICLLFSACAAPIAAKPAAVRLDFTCISSQQGDRLMFDCADPQTWKEWMEKNKKYY